MLGNEKDLHTGSLLPLLLNQTARFQAIHSRHRDIEHHDVRLQTFDLIQGLNPIRCLTNYFPPRTPFQQSSQPLPHDWMIIHQQYPDCHNFSFLVQRICHRRKRKSPADHTKINIVISRFEYRESCISSLATALSSGILVADGIWGRKVRPRMQQYVHGLNDRANV